MIRKILPLLLALVAFLGGAAAGDMIRGKAGDQADSTADHAAVDAPVADAEGAGHGAGSAPADALAAAPAKPPAAPTDHGAAASAGSHGSGDPASPAWFQFPQQFFVPVLHDGRLDSTMVLTLSAEMPGATSEKVYAHEIKLRDALLRQLLIHANTGGFDGNFTSEAHLRGLRGDLTSAMQAVVPDITGILIGDIARQER